VPRPITATLAALQGGLFVDTCSELFAQLVRSVDETGKAGKLTITLDLKKVSGAISVTPKVTDKTPEPAPESELFYATVEGNLSRDNPAQQKLDLRQVDTAPTEVRTLPAEERAVRTI
jgi:hypothetical protein